MTNLEWMLSEKKDFMIDSLSNCIHFGVDKNGNVDSCRNINCGECLFDGGCLSKCKEWLNAEHNPYSIPLNTPTDARVLVKQYEVDKWEKRYFAGFSKDTTRPYKCFADGKTSWTTNVTKSWEYCRLASEEEKGAEE